MAETATEQKTETVVQAVPETKTVETKTATAQTDIAKATPVKTEVVDNKTKPAIYKTICPVRASPKRFLS